MAASRLEKTLRTQGGAHRLELLTLMLTDVVASTRQWEADPDEMSVLLAEHDFVIGDVVARWGGELVRSKGEGDSTFSAFDDPVAALAAAADVHRELPDGIGIRTAVHTGEVERRDGDFYGTPANRVARLRSIANRGQILVSAATAALASNLSPQLRLRDLGERRLRSLAGSERVFQLTGPGLRDEFPPLRWVDPTKSNVPVPSTSLVGRVDDLVRVAELVTSSRVTTLVGPGGGGKTRLAIEVAIDLIPRFEGGVWFVDLAPERRPDAVAARAAQAVGVEVPAGADPLEALAQQQGSTDLLLVLDNCEHVVDTCRRVAAHMASAGPGVRVLCTSRMPVGVDGEALWRVQPLAVDPHSGEPGDAEAVQLFVARARAHDPGFTVDAAGSATIARICRRLDGVPLAIELAAARTRLLSLEQLADRLDRTFATLTGPPQMDPRHRTVEALVESSYELLGPEARTLFRRLGIFRGPFTLDDADSVCCDDGLPPEHVLDALSELVDQHLVVADTQSDPARYRMLETLRSFAEDRLRSTPEARAVGDRHLAHFLEVASLTRSVPAREQSRLLDRLATVRADTSAAIDHAVATGQADEALSLGAALWRYWFVRDPTGAEAHLDAILSMSDQDSEARVQCLVGRGLLHPFDQRKAGEAFAREALAMAERIGTPRAIGDAYMGLANLVYFRDPAACLRLAEEAVRWHRRGPDRQGERISRWTIGLALAETGEIARAASILRQILREAEEAGDDFVIRQAAYILGQIVEDEEIGEVMTSLEDAADRLGETTTFGERRAFELFMQADLAARRGEVARARELFDRSVDKAITAVETGRAESDTLMVCFHAVRALYAAGDRSGAEGFLRRADRIDAARPLRPMFGWLRATIARDDGDLASAAAHLRDALAGQLPTPRDVKRAHVRAVTLRCAATIAALHGEASMAARWWLAAETHLREVAPDTSEPGGLWGAHSRTDVPYHDRDRAIVRGELTASEFARRLERTDHMNPSEALTEAIAWLDLAGPLDPRSSARTEHGPSET